MTPTHQYHRSPTTGDIVAIKVEGNGSTKFVPLKESNADYAEIMRQVEAGELTIQEADNS